MGYVPPPFVGQQPFSLDENEPDEPFATPAADASANEPDGVFIGNLPSSATAPLLTELFLQAGPLQGDVRLPKDATGTGHRGFAFAEYRDPGSVPYAIVLFDGLHFGGRPLRVNESGAGRNATAQPVNPTIHALRELAMNPSAWDGEVPMATGDGFGHLGERRQRSPAPSPPRRRRDSRSRSRSSSRGRRRSPSWSPRGRRRGQRSASRERYDRDSRRDGRSRYSDYHDRASDREYEYRSDTRSYRYRESRR